MLGIRTNNKHSYDDFGLRLLAREIGFPAKRKVKVNVPFMQGSYDFSCLYGEQTYDERELTYTFSIPATERTLANMKKIKVADWLSDGLQKPLYDDELKGLYFMAECTGITYDESTHKYFKIIVTFTAYPFKISTLQDGHDIWDDFNFELDMIQETKFDINGSKNITLYNNGTIGINPTVICSSNFEVIKGNRTYLFKAGESKSLDFKLDKGENNLIVSGNGTIEFKWFKEVL